MELKFHYLVSKARGAGFFRIPFLFSDMVSYGSHLSYIKKRLWRNGWGCCEQCLYGDPILRCYVLNGQTVKKSAEKNHQYGLFLPIFGQFSFGHGGGWT